MTSYHQDVKWHDESSFLSCGESIALNEIYQNIISGRQKHMYKNYTYVGVITPKLVIIIIYNKTKVNIIDTLLTKIMLNNSLRNINLQNLIVLIDFTANFVL